jgi:hypothetical protein
MHIKVPNARFGGTEKGKVDTFEGVSFIMVWGVSGAINLQNKNGVSAHMIFGGGMEEFGICMSF